MWLKPSRKGNVKPFLPSKANLLSTCVRFAGPFLTGAAGGVAQPVLLEIPAYRLANAGIECFHRRPVDLARQVAGVDRIAAVMDRSPQLIRCGGGPLRHHCILDVTGIVEIVLE